MKRCALFLLVLAVFSAAPAWPQQRRETSAAQRQFLGKLVAAAIERTHHSVRYDPSYIRIPYPNGDVPSDTGVCTDVIIRIYRAVGVDLQKEVHEDMLRNFSAYPNERRWHLTHTDTNIDHRRVPNLMTFFARKGESLPITSYEGDYAPGDLVTLGSRRQCAAHRHCCGPQIAADRALHDRPQHRTGTEDGRRAIQLEDHRPLSLLRTAKSLSVEIFHFLAGRPHIATPLVSNFRLTM